MSVSVLLKLLNELWKLVTMQGFAKHFSNKFNNFNKKAARKLDSIYQMALKLFCNHTLCMKTS